MLLSTTSTYGRTFLHLGLVNAFVDIIPNSEATKEKIYINTLKKK